MQETLIVSTIWKAPWDIFGNVESANGIFDLPYYNIGILLYGDNGLKYSTKLEVK